MTKFKSICISMTLEAIEQLEKIHQETGKSKSRIIRDGIKLLYEKMRERQNDR